MLGTPAPIGIEVVRVNDSIVIRWDLPHLPGTFSLLASQVFIFLFVLYAVLLISDNNLAVTAPFALVAVLVLLAVGRIAFSSLREELHLQGDVLRYTRVPSRVIMTWGLVISDRGPSYRQFLKSLFVNEHAIILDRANVRTVERAERLSRPVLLLRERDGRTTELWLAEMEHVDFFSKILSNWMSKKI